MRTISAVFILITLACLHDLNHCMQHAQRSHHLSTALASLEYADLNAVRPVYEASYANTRPRSRTHYRAEARKNDRSGLPEENNDIYDIQGEILEDLEDEYLPSPDRTYLAPGERIDDVIEWEDGTFNVISHDDANTGRPNDQKTDPDVRPSEVILEPSLLGHVLFEPPHPSGRHGDHHPRVSSKDRAAKAAAEQLLSMLTAASKCVIGQACSEDKDCCSSHTCRKYSESLQGTCFPLCDFLVEEGGNCNMCACASDLECMEVPVGDKMNEKICVKPLPKGKPCSNNNQCKPEECCLVKPHTDEGAIARCHRNLSPFESCQHVKPHPFMNVFEGSCPCDHSSGVVCIDGTCGRKH